MASAHDFAEIARSASEAKKTTLRDVDLRRYQNPSPNTCYALEYAFYLLPDIREKVVLDLGCGSGEELVPLCQRGARVIGIDISPDLIALAYQRLRKYGVDAELRIASAYDTKLADESVDVVFCMSLLHHLQLDRVQPEIARILKPNGLLILKEPIRFSWSLKQLRRFFPAQEDTSEFEHPLNAEQLNALMEAFQVQASRSFRTPLVPVLTRTIERPDLQHLVRSYDAGLLRRCPRLEHYATVRVMALAPRRSSIAVIGPRRLSAPVISIKSEAPCPQLAPRSLCRLAIILLFLTLALVSTVVLRGISKGEFHINVDESQHAASGLFYASLLRDAPVRHPIQYTYRYYAQYPALSGVIHWPPLFYGCEGLFFIVFGASVITARITILLFSLMACIFWFRLVYDIQDEWTAGASTALMALLPSVLLFEKAVMLEIPCLALSVAALYYWYQYLTQERTRALHYFALLAAAALLTKQNAIFLVMTCSLTIVIMGKWRLAVNRRILGPSAVVMALIVPFYGLVFHFHRSTIAMDLVRHAATAMARGSDNYALRQALFYITALRLQLGWILLALAIVGVLSSPYWGKREAHRFMLAWILACYVTFTLISHKEPRYSLYWIPPVTYFVSGPLLARWRVRAVHIALAGCALLLITHITVVAWHYERPYVTGYAPLAQRIVESSRKGIVLFDAPLPANFIFFLRRLDSKRGFLVLRKALWSTRIKPSGGAEEFANSRDHVQQIINREGVKYIVVSDVPVRFESQTRLRDLLEQDSQFELLDTIAIHSNEPQWQGKHLFLYRNTLSAPPTDKFLHIRMMTLSHDLVLPWSELSEVW